MEQLFQSHINSDLAKIYTRMIYPEMVDERIAKVLPKLLYARRITCDNPDMRQVVLCYEEMKGETHGLPAGRKGLHPRIFRPYPRAVPGRPGHPLQLRPLHHGGDDGLPGP